MHINLLELQSYGPAIQGPRYRVDLMTRDLDMSMHQVYGVSTLLLQVLEAQPPCHDAEGDTQTCTC